MGFSSSIEVKKFASLRCSVRARLPCALEVGPFRGPKGRTSTALGNTQGDRTVQGRSPVRAAQGPRTPQDQVKVGLTMRFTPP